MKDFWKKIGYNLGFTKDIESEILDINKNYAYVENLDMKVLPSQYKALTDSNGTVDDVLFIVTLRVADSEANSGKEYRVYHSSPINVLEGEKVILECGHEIQNVRDYVPPDFSGKALIESNDLGTFVNKVISGDEVVYERRKIPLLNI